MFNINQLQFLSPNEIFSSYFINRYPTVSPIELYLSNSAIFRYTDLC